MYMQSYVEFEADLLFCSKVSEFLYVAFNYSKNIAVVFLHSKSSVFHVFLSLTRKIAMFSD